MNVLLPYISVIYFVRHINRTYQVRNSGPMVLRGGGGGGGGGGGRGGGGGGLNMPR